MNKIKTLPKVPFEGYWIYTGNPFKVVSCRNGCYCLEESGLRSGTLEHNYILEENLLDMYNKGDIALYSEKDEVVELTSHNKYSREIKKGIYVDVYDVLRAFKVVDPALQHLIKKALCVGIRGHKDALEDYADIVDSSERALQMYKENI